MKFKVGDVIQLNADYKYGSETIKTWRLIILRCNKPWFAKPSYDLVCINVGKAWQDKKGVDGIDLNFHKIDTANDLEMELARMLYL